MKLTKQKAIKDERQLKAARLTKMLLKLAEEHSLEEVLKTLDVISVDDRFDINDRRWYRDAFGEMVQDKGFEVITCTGSLAEQYKIEAFREELYSNPYQLKLIA